jgi:hypothetical protein
VSGARRTRPVLSVRSDSHRNRRSLVARLGITVANSGRASHDAYRESTMPGDTALLRRDARDALRRYLRECPDAADTLVGIAQWWLPETMRDISMDGLRLALADLIVANEVRCTILPDGTELFSRSESTPRARDDRGDSQ